MLYIINLDTDVQRMMDMSTRLNNHSIQFERFTAFDGRNLKKNVLDELFYKHFNIHLTEEVSGAQAGCFISQFRVWEKIANGSDDYGVVFEDDIHFSSDLQSFLSSDEWLPSNFDIVRLEISTNRLLLSHKNVLSFDERSIHLLESTSWCAGAYVISKACAKKITSYKFKNFISADAFLFCFEKSEVARDLNIYQVSPALAIQDKFILDQDKVGYESNIETDAYLNRLWWRFKTFITTFSFTSIIKKAFLGYKRVVFK